MKKKCSICKLPTKYYLTKLILKKYKVKYLKCTNCHFIEAEKPRYWLEEAYSSAIIDADTGIIGRNLILSKISSIIFLLFCNKKSKVLDYAGGYGITTRMLRDIGIDCYWKDKYAENIFAKGFEDNGKTKYDMITAFELFEHLGNPVEKITGVIKKYKPEVLFFTTMLHDGNPSNDWWYFANSGGQHISLYTKKSLKILAKKAGMKLSSNDRNIHILSKKRIPDFLVKIISVLWPAVPLISPLIYKSKTFSDYLKATSSK